MMSARKKKAILGIIADESAMYELLEKFLTKEGYEVRRASQDLSADDDFALIIYAPTRESSQSKDWFEGFMKLKRAVLVVQCCDEDYVEVDENVVVISERPLNLRHLGNTVEKAIVDFALKTVSQPSAEVDANGFGR